MKVLSLYYKQSNESESDKVIFDRDTSTLTIFFSNYDFASEGKRAFFTFLDKNQVINAAELGDSEVVYKEKVYKFLPHHENILLHTGRVRLRFIDDLKNYISLTKDKNFIYKYYKRVYEDNLKACQKFKIIK